MEWDRNLEGLKLERPILDIACRDGTLQLAIPCFCLLEITKKMNKKIEMHYLHHLWDLTRIRCSFQETRFREVFFALCNAFSGRTKCVTARAEWSRTALIAVADINSQGRAEEQRQSQQWYHQHRLNLHVFCTTFTHGRNYHNVT